MYQGIVQTGWTVKASCSLEGGFVSSLVIPRMLALSLSVMCLQVLCLLLEFLAQVAALSKVNEMTSEALAQVCSSYVDST